MLCWLRWGLASVPHRGDTGYSAEKAAALPPAQLSNCHQQRPPPRLSLSTSQKANCPLPCVLWTSPQDPLSSARTPSRLPVHSPPSPPLPHQTLPAWTFRPSRSLSQGHVSHCLCPWPPLTRWIWYTGSCPTFPHSSFLASFLPLSPDQKQLKYPSQRRHILPNAPHPHLPEPPTCQYPKSFFFLPEQELEGEGFPLAKFGEPTLSPAFPPTLAPRPRGCGRGASWRTRGRQHGSLASPKRQVQTVALRSSKAKR